MNRNKSRRVDRRLEEVRRFLHSMLDRPDLLTAFPEEVYVPLGANVSSLFATGRLELLQQISQSSATVGELARALHRKVPSVSRDLRMLEKHGLIRFRSEGKRKYPELLRHFVVIPLSETGTRVSRRTEVAA